MIDLKTIYREALARCEPERLVAQTVASFEKSRAYDVVAIGKCAGALLDGVASVLNIGDAFVALPAGYREPRTKAEVAIGGHPDMTRASFDAGERLVRFVDAHDDLLFLISGGGSACVELPLAPHFNERDLIETNRALVGSGLSIGEMNVVRKHLSAIKGGRLAARVRGRSTTLILSDVSTGALADVASGPTLPDASTTSQANELLARIGSSLRIGEKVPETIQHLVVSDVHLIADNAALTRAAAAFVDDSELWDGQLECGVGEAARLLAARAAQLPPGKVLIAGGEPSVVKRGDGKGGRCSELALYFAMQHIDDVQALFASSDGIDGSTGVAGIYLPPNAHVDVAEANAALEQSDSFPLASRIGEAIMIPPSGNNLRDLYLLARG